MQFLTLLLGTVAIVHSAVISPKHHENFPSIKTLINELKAQDTQQVTVQHGSEHKVDCVHGHEHVNHPGTGNEKTVVVQPVQQHFINNNSPSLVKYGLSTIGVTDYRTVNVPSLESSVVGPSGSITQKKYLQPIGQYYGNYGVVKNNPVAVEPVVFGNVVQGSGVVSIPSQKTSIVGPSGTITEEKYPQYFTYGKSNDIYSIVENNPETGKPVVVQYKKPVLVNVDVPQVYVNTPSEKTSVVGPSGSITQEKYLSSISSTKSDQVYGVVKNNPVTGKPVVIEYKKPVSVNDVVPQVYANTPSEKTSVVGPSGSITQEKYLSSISSAKSDEVYGVVKNNPVTGKPFVVQYKKPVLVNVDAPQVYVNTPSEKTSVVGPSGSITQEKFLSSVSSAKSDEVYGVVTNNPVTGKPVVVEYKKPVSVNVDVPQVYVNTPSEKTSVVGPSGSITQEKYLSSISSAKSDEVYGVVKNNPVTGKPFVVQYKKPVLVNVDAPQVYVNTSSEKTSVVGPSGSITQEKYLSSISSAKSDEVYGVVKNNPVTGKPFVVQYKKPVSVNVDVPQVYLNTPSEKTSVVGPSGSITQEKYLSSISSAKSDEVYGVVKNNPVTGKPFVVQYKKPVFVNVDAPQVYVNTPSEKTSVVGPSGSITQEKFLSSISSAKSDEVYGVVKNNPVTGKPYVVQYKKPVLVNDDVSQVYVNTPSEKTSVVGPSGSITQEKYLSSISSTKSDQVYGVVKNNPVTGKPVVVEYKQPVSVHVNAPQVYVNTPSEKTSVVGPSGSITQEKYLQSTPIGQYNGVYSFVKNNPVTEKPIKVQYLEPVFGNVAVGQGYNVISTPSEKTSFVGPSGSITQKKYFQSSPTGKYNEIYGVVKNNPTNEEPVVVHNLEPVYGNVAVAQGYYVVNPASDKYYTPSSTYGFKYDHNKIVSVNPYSNPATVYYNTIPYGTNLVEVSGNQVTKEPVSYNSLNSDYIIKYGTPLNQIIALAYGLDDSVEKTSSVGSNAATTNENETKTEQVTQVQDVQYPEIEQYPNIAAPDC